MRDAHEPGQVQQQQQQKDMQEGSLLSEAAKQQSQQPDGQREHEQEQQQQPQQQQQPNLRDGDVAQAEMPNDAQPQKRDEEQRWNDKNQPEENLDLGHLLELQQQEATLRAAQKLLLLLSEEPATVPERSTTGEMGANSMNKVRNTFF